MGASIAFLHPKDVGGVLTELVQAAETALTWRHAIPAGGPRMAAAQEAPGAPRTKAAPALTAMLVRNLRTL